MKKLLLLLSFITFLAFSERYVDFENNLDDIAVVDHQNQHAWESAVIYINNVIFNPGDKKTILLRKNDICLHIETQLNKWDNLGKLFGGKTEMVFRTIPTLQTLIKKLPDHYTLSCHINFQFTPEQLEQTEYELSDLACHIIDMIKEKKVIVSISAHLNPQPGLLINLSYS